MNFTYYNDHADEAELEASSGSAGIEIRLQYGNELLSVTMPDDEAVRFAEWIISASKRPAARTL